MNFRLLLVAVAGALLLAFVAVFALPAHAQDGSDQDPPPANVDEPPSAPARLRVVDRRSGSLLLSWTAPGNTGKPAITGYELQYRLYSSGSDGPWLPVVDAGEGPTGTVPNLAPHEEYVIRVRAVNEAGSGEWSETLEVLTASTNVCEGDNLLLETTLTVGNWSGNRYGYHLNDGHGSIGNNAFTYPNPATGEDEDLTIEFITMEQESYRKILHMSIGRTIPDLAGTGPYRNLVLCVEGRVYSFAHPFSGPQPQMKWWHDWSLFYDAVPTFLPATDSWSGSLYNWREGDPVNIRIANAPRPIFLASETTYDLNENTGGGRDLLPYSSTTIRYENHITPSGKFIAARFTGPDADSFEHIITYRLRSALYPRPIFLTLETKSGVAYDHEAKPAYELTLELFYVDKPENGDWSDYDASGIADSPLASLDVHVVLNDLSEPPRAPDLTALHGDGQIALSWTAPDNTGRPAITDYEYKVNGGWNSIGSSTSTVYALTGLTNGTAYTYQVRAVNEDGAGRASNAATATPSLRPGPPANLAAVVAGINVALSWDPPDYTGGADIIRYEYRYRAAGDADYGAWTGVGDVTGYTVPSPMPDTRIERLFQVRAVTSQGEGAAGGPVTATFPFLPGAPINLSIERYPVEGDAAPMTFWFEPPADDGGSAILEYNFRQETEDVITQWHRLHHSAVTVGYYRPDIAADQGSTTIRFRARNVVGWGPASEGLTFSPGYYPGAPTDLTAEAESAGQADLAWTKGADNNLAHTGHEVRYKVSEADSWGEWTDTGSAGPESADQSHAVTGLTPSVTYVSQVRGVNEAGPGDAGNEAAVTVVGQPGVPLNLRVERKRLLPNGRVLTDTLVDPPPENGSEITNYAFEYSRALVSTAFSYTSLDWQFLDPGRVYAVKARAENEFGWGEWTDELVFTAGWIPEAPTDLSAGRTGTGELTLTWTRGSDRGLEHTGYQCRYKVRDADSWGEWTDTGSADESLAVTGLTNGTEYVFQVRGVNEAGSGDPGGELLASPVSPPGVPTSLIAQAGHNRITLSWTAPADNSGLAVTGYEYNVNGGPGWHSTGGAGTAYTLTGLDNGTAYTLLVRAVNEAGAGPASSAATATPSVITVTVSADRESVAEGEAAVFTLSRSGPSAAPLTVSVSVSDPGGFLRGSYFNPVPEPLRTVEFAAGSATTSLSLQTQDAWRDIPDNDVAVTALAADSYDVGSAGSDSVTVTDNDVAPDLELVLDKTTVEEGGRLALTMRRSGTYVNPTSTWVRFGIRGETSYLRQFVLDDPEPVATLYFPIEDDDVDAPDRTFEATVLPVGGEDSPVPVDAGSEYWTVRPPTTVTATVTDNDLPVVSVRAVRSSYSEGEIGKIRLRRAGDTSVRLAVTIEFTQSPGATDQFGTSARVLNNFNPGVTELLHTYLLSENDGDEEDGFISVAIVPDDAFEIDSGAAAARFTVVDTDPMPILSIANANGAEGGGSIDFEVSYSGSPSTKTITFDYATADRTGGNIRANAVAGFDYTATNGTVTLAPGTQSATISVPVLDDEVAEGEKRFNFTVSNVVNAGLLDSQDSHTAAGIIRDDEPAVYVTAGTATITEGESMVFDLSRTGDAADALSVRLAIYVDTAREVLIPEFTPIVTFPAGDSTVTYEFPTVDDDLDEPDAVSFAELLTPSYWGLPNNHHVSIATAYVTVLDNDLPKVTITSAALVTEGEAVQFTLAREGDVTGSLTVNVRATSTWNLVSDTLPSTVVFAAGEGDALLSLATQDDETAGQNGSVTVELLTGTEYRLGEPAAATMFVLDDDGYQPLVEISAAEPWVTEGEDIVFTLTRTAVGLDQPLTAYVNVYTRFYAGSFDYSEITSARHEVVFEAGAATATLVRATVDETANDGNSLVKALLNLGQYRQKASTRAAEVWIRNDDIPTVTMLVDAFEYVETGSPIPVTAVRTGDTTYDLPMMFQYSVVDNFPEWILTPNYLDRWSIFTGKVRTYGRSDNHLTIFDFGPGESTETIATGPGATTPFGSTFRMQILPRYCDEVPGDCHYLPQYRVGALDTTVVELLNDGMGVRVVADEVSVSEGEAASFTLHRYGNRRADRVRPLTVRVQVTQDGEFIEGVPPQTVTFGGAAEADLNIGTPDGEMSTTITIPTSDDLLDEADGAITLTILPPDQDLIVAPDAYPNIYGLADTTIPGYANAATVAVTDNDIAGVQIADAEAHEGAGTIDFTVTLQESAVEVTVGWMTTQDDGDDAATEGDDYSEASGVLTFAPGETSKTVSVTLLDDDVSEPDETFSVELLNPSDVSEESLLSGPATGTIFNDDAPQDIDAQSAAHGPVEEGQDVVFHLERFNLNSGDRDRVKARARLVLQVEITQEGDVIRGAAPTEVVFEQGSWTATVTVRTDDDDLLEPTGTVSLRVVGVGTFVQTFATPIAVTVWDNDNPLSIANAGAGEDEGEIVFTVSLGEPAARQITVNAATIDGTATSHGVRSDGDLGRDFWAKSETLTFQPGEQTKTFSVTLVNDLYDEESKEIFTVRLSNPVSARLQDPSAKGRITDNDDPMYVRLSEPPSPHPEDTELVRFSLGLNHLSTRASERDVVIE